MPPLPQTYMGKHSQHDGKLGGRKRKCELMKHYHPRRDKKGGRRRTQPRNTKANTSFGMFVPRRKIR